MLAGLLAYLSGHKEDFANETLFMVLLVVSAVLLVVTIVGYWKVFEKMGEPGWKAIVPIYNNWVIFQRCAEVRQVFWVYCTAAVVEVAANFGIFGPVLSLGIEDWARTIACGTELYMFFEMARCFGQGWKDGIGMWILEFIYIPRLGFDASEYRGRHTSTGHKYLQPASAPHPNKSAAAPSASKPATAPAPVKPHPGATPATAPAKRPANTTPAAAPAKRPDQAPAATEQATPTAAQPSQAPATPQRTNPASARDDDAPARDDALAPAPHAKEQDIPASPQD